MSRRGDPGGPAPGLLQVVLSLDPGGAERLVVDMSKRLARRAAVAVCCLDGEGAWAPELIERGIPVEALRRGPGFRPSLALHLARAARRRGARVLHCHQYTPFVYGSLAALLSPGLRVVYTEHGRLSDAPPGPRRRAVQRLLGRVPSAVVAVCRDLGEEMEASGMPRGGVRVIYNGIDPGEAPRPGDRAAARAALGLSADALVVGSVARLDPVKDLASLIAGFAELAGADAGAQLVLVGDGPERRRLAEAARRHGLSERVRFTGHRDDVRRLLAGFDIYVNSSITEAHSVTVLEAMAAGLPVVATRAGGNPEVVADGETGRLVTPRDVSGLAAALAELAADPLRRRALGRAGRARLEADFTLEGMIRSYLELYRLD